MHWGPQRLVIVDQYGKVLIGQGFLVSQVSSELDRVAEVIEDVLLVAVTDRLAVSDETKREDDDAAWRVPVDTEFTDAFTDDEEEPEIACSKAAFPEQQVARGDPEEVEQDPEAIEEPQGLSCASATFVQLLGIVSTIQNNTL